MGYRLTAADYSSGDSYDYTYDAVGNRLTSSGPYSVTSYQYDDANRLTEVNGVAHTWDNNGNLLNDGVNAYTYDAANRLKSLTGPAVAASYAHNGLGDRLQETLNGQPTTFTMDLNIGLTQALSDGTNTYLYGNGRLAQVNTSTEYFLGDALGSVRQLANANGAVTYASAYDPYGVMTQASGASQTAHGYTNEYTDSYIKLIYLRSRWYNPTSGRFLTKDPSRTEANLYLYTSANPINRTDPTGLNSDFLTGPMSFTLCFDFHSLTHGWSHDADVDFAIDICKAAFSKDAWNPKWFDLSGDLPQSAHDLMGWYLYEQGNRHLWFDGDQSLTRELAKSTLIHDVRMRYYLGHGDTSGKVENRFGYFEFIRSMTLDMRNINKFSLPISFFLGSFYYQVRTLPNDRVGFRIDNVTSLASGTHIAGRYDDKYFGSVEELLEQGVIEGSARLSDVVKIYPVISILYSRTRDEMDNSLGGGNLYQTYTWTERRSDCPIMLLPQYIPLPEPSMEKGIESLGYSSYQPWPDYKDYTEPVFETWR